MLKIDSKGVVEDGVQVGLHYHYEVVTGLSDDNPLARWVSNRVSAKPGPDLFAAWRRHNVIEIDVFKNFLPSLYAPRENLWALAYRPDMNPVSHPPDPQEGHRIDRYESRLAGFKEAADPLTYPAYREPSFL